MSIGAGFEILFRNGTHKQEVPVLFWGNRKSNFFGLVVSPFFALLCVCYLDAVVYSIHTPTTALLAHSDVLVVATSVPLPQTPTTLGLLGPLFFVRTHSLTH